VSYQPFVSIPLDIATTSVASGCHRDHETIGLGGESASATAAASDVADEWVTIKSAKATAKAFVAAPPPAHTAATAAAAAAANESDLCLSVDDALAAFMRTEPLYGFKNPGSSQVIRLVARRHPSLVDTTILTSSFILFDGSFQTSLSFFHSPRLPPGDSGVADSVARAPATRASLAAQALLV
jgi:hypothetical protein